MREFFKVLQKEQSCDHRIGGLCSILESPASQSRTHSQYHRHHWEFIKMQPPPPPPQTYRVRISILIKSSGNLHVQYSMRSNALVIIKQNLKKEGMDAREMVL